MVQIKKVNFVPYRTGQCTDTNNPLISFRKKYQSYWLCTDCTGEIQLFRSENGYRAETWKVSFVRKENKRRRKGRRQRRSRGGAMRQLFLLLLSFFSSSSLSVSLSLSFAELCYVCGLVSHFLFLCFVFVFEVS